MMITRTSVLTGQTRTRELEVSEEALSAFMNGDKTASDAFPNLSDEEREFLTLGIVPEETEEYENGNFEQL